MLTVHVHSVEARGGSASVRQDAWLWPVLVLADARSVPAALAGRPAEDTAVVVGEPVQATVGGHPSAHTVRTRRKRSVARFTLDPELGSLGPKHVRAGFAVLLTTGDPGNAKTAAAVARFRQELQGAVSREIAGLLGLPDLQGMLAGEELKLPEVDLSSVAEGGVPAFTTQSSELQRLSEGAVHAQLNEEAQRPGAALGAELGVLARLATDPTAAARLPTELEVPRADGGTGGARTAPSVSTRPADLATDLRSAATVASTSLREARLSLSPSLRLAASGRDRSAVFSTSALSGGTALSVASLTHPTVAITRPQPGALALAAVDLAHLDLEALVEAAARPDQIVASFLETWTLAQVQERGTVTFKRALKSHNTRRLSFQVKGAVVAEKAVVGRVSGVSLGNSQGSLGRLEDGTVIVSADGRELSLSRFVRGTLAASQPVTIPDSDGRAIVVFRSEKGELVGLKDTGRGRWTTLPLGRFLEGKPAGELSITNMGETNLLAWRNTDSSVGIGMGSARGAWRPLPGPDLKLASDPTVVAVPRGGVAVLAGVDTDGRVRAFSHSRGRWKETELPAVHGATGRPSLGSHPSGQTTWLAVRDEAGAVQLLAASRGRWSNPVDLTEASGAPSATGDPSLAVWHDAPWVVVLGDDLAVHVLANRPGLGWSRRSLSRSLGQTEAARDPSVAVEGDALVVRWTTSSGRTLTASRSDRTDWALTGGVAR